MVRAARIALLLYLVAGASITLGARPEVLFDAGLRNVEEATGGAFSSTEIEAGANVVLFIPLAFLLCRSFPAVRRRLVFAACVAASAAVELFQYVLPGRDAAGRDLAMNALGAAVGVALSWALDRAVVRDSRAHPG